MNMQSFTAMNAALPAQILVANDAGAGRADMVSFLEGHGMRATTVGARAELLRAMTAQEPDAIILDRQLGSDDGLDLLRDIRTKSTVPVILTSGSFGDEIDRVVGLEFGADDYLTGPFELRELLARVRAVLRRSNIESAPKAAAKYRRYRFGVWTFDQRQRRLEHTDGTAQRLTKSEFALLSAFVVAPGRVLSREHLLQATRRHEDIYDRSVDVQVLRLRRKLGDDPRDPRLIRTERGVGYVFDVTVQLA